MLILGIETSCDETAAAVIEDGRWVRSNVISSQITLHRKTGGVVPEVAAREHIAKIIPVIDRALKEAKTSLKKIDLIAVTEEPGLNSSLVIGTTTAAIFGLALKKTVVPVNHIRGHIYANWLENKETFQFPIMILTVSGGHNELILMKDYENFELVGETRDDAAGEAFDKVARILGLGYPGGPEIEKAAKKGDPAYFPLPKVMMGEESLDFSFSGLKTAVLRLVQKSFKRNAKFVNNLAASFQDAVTEILAAKLIRAASRYKVKEIHLAGGVSANKILRKKVKEKLETGYLGYTLRYPLNFSFCTDNAAMIAAAGYFKIFSICLRNKM